MPLRLVLDENLRHEAIASAIQSNESANQLTLGLLRVGDPGAPPLGTSDPDLIAWAAAQDRILVTLDAETLVRDLLAFAQSGQHSPGAIVLRHGLTAEDVVVLLELVIHHSAAADWANACQWLP